MLANIVYILNSLLLAVSTIIDPEPRVGASPLLISEFFVERGYTSPSPIRSGGGRRDPIDASKDSRDRSDTINITDITKRPEFELKQTQQSGR